MRGGHSAYDDGRMRAEGSAISAATQRISRYTSCRIKFDSCYAAEGGSAAVNASDSTTADGLSATKQEEQRRELAGAAIVLRDVRLRRHNYLIAQRRRNSGVAT